MTTHEWQTSHVNYWSTRANRKRHPRDRKKERERDGRQESGRESKCKCYLKINHAIDSLTLSPFLSFILSHRLMWREESHTYSLSLSSEIVPLSLAFVEFCTRGTLVAFFFFTTMNHSSMNDESNCELKLKFVDIQMSRETRKPSAPCEIRKLRGGERKRKKKPFVK